VCYNYIFRFRSKSKIFWYVAIKIDILIRSNVSRKIIQLCLIKSWATGNCSYGNNSTELRRKKENKRFTGGDSPAVRSQFFGNWRGTSPETLMWDLDIERSSRRSNEEWKLDRIINLDEWSKFDRRGRSAILDDEGQGPRSGKFSRTHVVHVAPGAPPLPLFFLRSLFIYLLLFRGPRIFFLPLGRPSAATEGAAKMQDLWGGVRSEKRKKDARTVRRQTRDDPRRMHSRGRKTDGEQRGDRGIPSSGGNGLRPSLRSQLVALYV